MARRCSRVPFIFGFLFNCFGLLFSTLGVLYIGYLLIFVAKGSITTPLGLLQVLSMLSDTTMFGVSIGDAVSNVSIVVGHMSTTYAFGVSIPVLKDILGFFSSFWNFFVNGMLLLSVACTYLAYLVPFIINLCKILFVY
ncbi:MAG: hypothetical protein HUJ61_06545 [Bacilli bacterium]|nr:hypothetical protein [Bacilli bacterium]